MDKFKLIKKLWELNPGYKVNIVDHKLYHDQSRGWNNCADKVMKAIEKLVKEIQTPQKTVKKPIKKGRIRKK